MTKNEIDGLLLKYVFGEDIDKPPKWYYENFWLETLLCNSWPGLGLVAEEMEKKEPSCLLQLVRIYPAGDDSFYPTDQPWMAQFREHRPEDRPAEWEFVAYSKTPFMAVAVAALRAVGVEIPEEEVLND